MWLKIDRAYVIEQGYLRPFTFPGESINNVPLVRYAVTDKWESAKNEIQKLKRILFVDRTQEQNDRIDYLHKCLFDFDD